MTDFKVLSKSKAFAETGSAFDTTNVSKIKARAGGHDTIPPKPIDISAFSYSKHTDKPDPSHFTKRGTGSGGTLVLRGQESKTQDTKLPKVIAAPAFCPRPNPPNTELRRFSSATIFFHTSLIILSLTSGFMSEETCPSKLIMVEWSTV